MATILLFYICVVILKVVNAHVDLNWDPVRPAFDPQIYEDALDAELCMEQLDYIRNNTLLRFQFLESGARFPRGFLTGNTLDLGNYYQCLGINHQMEDSTIQGKYCMVQGPIQQNLKSITDEPDLTEISDQVLEDMLRGLEEYSKTRTALDVLTLNIKRMDNRLPGTILSNAEFRVAVCVPKTCTSEQGLSGLLLNVSNLGLEFQENFCRLPYDKPWVAVDYVTIAIFSLIGLITIASTGYDLWQIKKLNKDPKQLSKIYTSFSLYTNTRRLLTFTSTPGSLECVDGIRALAMIWVIVGHAFTSHPHWSNPLDTYTFSTAFSSLWLTAAHLTVDTFFFLSGLLVVYTTAGKLTGITLMKNLHLFYLNRLLRMFPILAVGILLEASVAHRISDGPDWQMVAVQADRCRTNWWATLLHIQNYVGYSDVCIGQTWYLAIDVQLHIIAPIVLVWVGRNRRSSWVALTVGLLVSLTSATAYNFVKEFPTGMMNFGREDEMMYYMVYYYMNTLTRASPYFVGMVSGYILYLSREQELKISKYLVAMGWCCALVLSSFAIYMTYPPQQVGWSNQLLDSLINSFQRPLWAICLSWMVFACVNGYGGPIDWFLSLGMWKLPARLSYGMYILHFSILTVVSRSRVAPVYFTVGTVLYQSLGLFALSFIVSFVATLFVDSPCSTIFKLILGGGLKKPKQPITGTKEMNEVSTANANGITNGGFDGEEKLKDK